MDSKPSDCTLCNKVGLKPLTRENVLFYYIPMQSVISYGALAVNVINPDLLASVVPKKGINILLVHTMCGISLYIYSRPHLKAVTNGKKAAYSILGSALFSMGSVLMWALVRSAMPKGNPGTTVVGLASGAVMLKLGYDYLADSDKNVTKSN